MRICLGVLARQKKQLYFKHGVAKCGQTESCHQIKPTMFNPGMMKINMTSSVNVDVASTQLRRDKSKLWIVSLLCKKILSISGMGVLACSSAVSATTNAEEAAEIQWRETMANVAPPSSGCFHATYPSTFWESVPCLSGDIQLHSHRHPHASPAEQETGAPYTGNTADYTLVASSLISQTIGSFPSVTGVTSETSVGLPEFDGDGNLGSNAFSLQINSNNDSRTSACTGGGSKCTVWQQFLYATDATTSGTGAIFIEYWLLDYGPTCPSGYTVSNVGNCYKNSAFLPATNYSIATLASMRLTGSAVVGGNDSVTFAIGRTAETVSAPDSVLQIGTIWKQSEFNVFGDAGGSEAVFNVGSSVTVNVAAVYGSTAAPKCGSNDGTTGESNNLNTLGNCVATGGANPAIQFTESFVPPTSFANDVTTVTQGTFSEGRAGTQAYGFQYGEFGSVSPAATTTGAMGISYWNIEDVETRGEPTTGHFAIYAGYDPSSVWLKSITCLGVTKSATTATYGFSDGVAGWDWTTGFGFDAPGATTQCTIVHE